ncbi:hypothetical protein G7Y89_g13334 [Cudoniella acicularis]|uniref:Uncharacterized protein n=1 Tax=Cudoniella acicularis TaxID=354080 RepID=A0A8H4RA33_9HELO|nr:hypothetical protein G7Y89_g13334 [Cudoniella acicularis]
MNTSGIGIKAIDKNPSVEDAHPTPKLLYIADANNGKPAPKLDLIKSLPANTEAAYSGDPAEPEKADGDAEGADESGREAFLGLNLAIFVKLWFLDVVEVEKERAGDDEIADEDAHEGETFFVEVKAVNAREDGGEGFEPDVKKTVNESDVEVRKRQDGFKEVEREWTENH